jgi:hypothetical protein
MKTHLVATVVGTMVGLTADTAFAADVKAEDISNVLMPVMLAIGSAAATVLTVAAGLVVAWLKKKLNLSDAEAEKIGLDMDALHRQALQTALTNAAGQALNRLGNELKGKVIEVNNPAVANAVNSVIKAAPDAVRYFRLEERPSEIAEKIIGKLPQVANTVTPPDR